MLTSPIGSLAWELKTGGKLRRLDRIRFLAGALRLRLQHRWLKLGGRYCHAAKRIEQVNLDEVWIPDTPAAKRALASCQQASPTFLINHCLRTYLFGAILGGNNQLHFDAELLYVASLLHDLGLTDTYRHKLPSCECFAVEAARLAYGLSADWHWPEPKRLQLREAISLHFNIAVPLKHGTEAHLLNAGAALDVIGVRLLEISPATRTAILQRYPRENFKQRMAECMQHEGHIRPDSRAAFMVQSLGFLPLIARAPFSD